MSFGLGPKYELVFRVITFRSVLHWSIFCWMCVVQLNMLSMITPRYLVSTVFSFLPSMLSLVKIFLFLRENTIATVFSGLRVKLATRLLSTSLFRTVCILCCITVRSVPWVRIHRSSANPCPSVRSVFIISSA